MYDLDNDGKISRDELLAILHMMVGANIRYQTDFIWSEYENHSLIIEIIIE